VTGALFAGLAAERERLARDGMYRPEFETDACGVGLIAATDGKPSRRVVQCAIDALKAVWHRGAVDADGKTGDGAGLHLDLPVRFFDDAIAASGHKPKPNRLAVGMIFLPRTDLGAQEACRTIVESAIIEAGYTIYGWRQVPVDVGVIGAKAQLTRPEIEQIMVAGPLPDEQSAAEFEKELYLVRRRIEKRVIAAADPGLLCLFALLPLDRLQGAVPGGEPVGLLPRPAGPALREPGRDLSPALFHQHLPAMVARPAVPVSCA
jgi:glutamate synthase (NADPH/NADH) large chain